MIQILLSLVLAVATIAEQPQNLSSTPNSVSPHSEDDAQQLRSVKPEDPVITVSGICRDTSVNARDSATCKTIVTREQFDRLIAALAAAGQPVPSNGRRQLAQTYVDLLAYREAASATENSPEFRDLMDLVRLRTLSEIHRRNLQARYRTPSPQDIDTYYHQHISNFTEIKLHRILIPKRNPSAEDQEKYKREALHVANDLRERAARGGDFDQLQKQGYASLSLPAPPGTDMGNRRPANLLAEERDEILALNAGGVSKVEEEAFSFVIYKVDEKSVLPEEAVKEEISREIFRQRLENALKEISSGVHPEFNEQYFPSTPANPSASAPSGSQQPPKRMPE